MPFDSPRAFVISLLLKNPLLPLFWLLFCWKMCVFVDCDWIFTRCERNTPARRDAARCSEKMLKGYLMLMHRFLSTTTTSWISIYIYSYSTISLLLLFWLHRQRIPEALQYLQYELFHFSSGRKKNSQAHTKVVCERITGKLFGRWGWSETKIFSWATFFLLLRIDVDGYYDGVSACYSLLHSETSLIR